MLRMLSVPKAFLAILDAGETQKSSPTGNFRQDVNLPHQIHLYFSTGNTAPF